jgi:hypothetical protein
MTTPTPSPTTAPELRCGSCGQPLDGTDKFCRECGLPTLHRAALHRAVPTAPPDAAEFRRAMDAPPDPQPFLRPGPLLAEPEPSTELTTSSVLKVTNPTFAMRMAGSTLLMVGLIIFLLGLGVFLLVMAFRG